MAEELKKNTRHEATVEGYSSEGLGVARLDGRVLFVQGGIAGELCEVLVMKVLKNTAYAKVTRVLRPSPHRREPECPYFGRCGGCAYWHMDYEEELAAKVQKVRDALERIGGQTVENLTILPAPSVEGYRNKVQYPVAPPAKIGFFRARSHEVIPVEHCLIQSPAADRIADAVRAWMTRRQVAGYDERTGRGWLRHVYVRTARDGAALVCLVASSETQKHLTEMTDAVRSAWPQTAGVVLNVNKKPGNGILGETYRTLWGRPYLTDTLCGMTFKLSAPSFYQVNRAQAEALYGKALEFAALTGRETVLDLYCGTGTITLVMARHAKEAIGTEIVPAAIADAKENAARNGVDNVRFLEGDAGAAAARLAAEHLAPDVVVVDPPRKGLSGAVIDAVVSMAPARVVYVSCDPATLGRDVKLFAERGYALTRAAAVDMFPRTHHVETVVLLSKLKYVHTDIEELIKAVEV